MGFAALQLWGRYDTFVPMKFHRSVLIGYFLIVSSAALAAEPTDLPQLDRVSPPPADSLPVPEASVSPVPPSSYLVKAMPPTQETTLEKVSHLIASAMDLLGVQYKYGGRSPETGLDCSGFVRYVFGHAAGLALPHNAFAMSMMGRKIPLDELRPGDLVFFRTLRKAFSHVGIYVGNHRFIHSPSPGGAVEVVDMREKYWASRYDGARRLSIY